VSAPWEKYAAADNSGAEQPHSVMPWEKYATAAPQKPAPPTGMDRAQAGVSGLNEGVADFLGTPGDALLNVWDLGKAGAGYAQSKVTGKPPSEIFDPADRSQYALSSEWIKNKLQDAGVATDAARPDDLASKVIHGTANLGMQAFMGAGLPGPETPPQTVVRNPKLDTLAKAREAGYVVPPTTANPTVTNRLLESIGGKAATAQEAAVRNQGVTDQLAKDAVGLHRADQLVDGVLPAIRAEAAKAYAPIRNVGTMRADAQYAKDLDAVLSKYTSAGQSFPGLAKNDIQELVDGARVKGFDSNSALDMISVLRDKADAAFRSGDKALGKANKAVAGAIENAIERSLSRRGDDGNKLLSAFKNARQLIAKSYSVEGALNPATGNVNARKLAADLTKGRPLTGPLRQIGKFGQAFPDAAQLVKGSAGVSALDTGIAAGSAAMSKEPGWLLYPLARQGARSFMLSDIGQNMLTKPSGPMDPRTQMALMMGNQSLIDQFDQR
jgi:hypothetical protein